MPAAESTKQVHFSNKIAKKISSFLDANFKAQSSFLYFPNLEMFKK